MSMEIDRKVAEALGWVKNDNPRPSGQLYGSYEWTEPQGHTECTESMIPHYSTDVAAAIEARDAFTNRLSGIERARFASGIIKAVNKRLGFSTGSIETAWTAILHVNAEDICAAILSANAGEGKG